MERESQDPGPAGIDRRHEARHAVERPCRVALESLPLCEVSGMTSNLSRSGMLIRIPDPDTAGELARVGARARVVIDLPASANYAPRSLECLARVVRADVSGDESPSLALEVHRMQIRERDEAAHEEAHDDSQLVQ